MHRGWVKIHRKIWDNPVVTKDTDYLAVWIYLLTNASHKKHDVYWRGKRITLEPGQLVTGRKEISKITKVNESKVYRIIKTLKTEQQIEQQPTRQGSLISIINWNEYQNNEQLTAQQVNNDRTTSEQRVNTIQECIEHKRMNNNDLFNAHNKHLNNKAKKKWLTIRQKLEGGV